MQCGGRLDEIERAFYDHNVAAAHRALGVDQLRRAWATGRAMPLERAIADALSLPRSRVKVHNRL